MNLDDARLSIGQVSQLSGLTVVNIRAWERRYGFPTPTRLASGHRRYTARDVKLIAEVLEQRSSGKRLSEALALIQTRNRLPRSSIMATIRYLLADVPPVELSKPTLLALSRVIEDEIAARADQAVLVGAFQKDQFRRQSHARWKELSRTSRVTITFALAGRRRHFSPMLHVDLAESDPLTREWAVVCDSPSFAACLAGTQRPPLEDGKPAHVYEALWTVEPRVVREATRTAVTLATSVYPRLQSMVAEDLDREPAADADTVRSATLLTNRVMATLDARRGMRRQ